MGSLLQRINHIYDRGEKRRLLSAYSFILFLHLLGFGMLFMLVAPRYPAMAGLGVIAYTFGLRHAFDADHISAIDNSTRKLLQDGKRPVAVGFFFSLGHSSVVFLLSLGLALAVRFVMGNVENGSLRSIGNILGTSISGLFLLLIGTLNLFVLVEIVSTYRKIRSGQVSSSAANHLVAGGPMSRIFGKFFRIITSSAQMYFIGFLFGLGFDTASEVALLAMSATAASQHLPLIGILTLPVIFAAGMSLMDTADGAFMAKAYSWAFSHPIRRIIYNVTVTGLSVFVALFIGIVELLQVLSSEFNWSGSFWKFVNDLNFGAMGIIIVIAFILAWTIATIIWKLQNNKIDHVRFAGLED
ncbi:MAG: HoxN/HupN/NixA family nickel/cobalt transporter [Chloroflexi bacterium]|nr:HoxN/HupN/NixA family nickel/cobalt transporter [Chloroflexota bacterium]